MAGPKIKLCGMTRAEDARIAAELGADFIGMVLHANSRRRIEVSRAKQIAQAIPSTTIPVGLFVDATIEIVRSIAQEVGLRHVQLHGSESPEYASELTGLTVFKALAVDASRLAETVEAWKAVRNVAALLLDSASAGGSGIENDWNAIRSLQTAGKLDGYPPLIVAGGLNPENVGSVVTLLKPWAVDVSTGIEESVGIKSRDKMERFIREVRRAASGTS